MYGVFKLRRDIFKFCHYARQGFSVHVFARTFIFVDRLDRQKVVIFGLHKLIACHFNRGFIVFFMRVGID